MKNTTDKVIRVALYTRVSTEEQVRHGYSLRTQEDELVRVANEKGWKIVKIYRDEGNSARKPALKRPVMLELLEDVKAGKIDLIAFIKLDRWFRNVREYHKVQAILDKHRVEWIATMEDYSTLTSDGRLKINIMLSVAENEADKASDRVKFVNAGKVARKEAIHTKNTTPFGYTVEKIDGVKRVVKDPETQHIMDDFFQMALAYSIRQAAEEMNEKYGLHRAYKLWWQDVKKEMYTGTYRGVEGYCEPYITVEQQQELSDRHKFIKKAQNNRVYLFAGLIRCPNCGHRLSGKYCTSTTTKMEFMYYRCQSKLAGLCDFKTVAEKKVEKHLLKNVRKELEKFVITAEAEPVSKKEQPKKNDSEKLAEKLRRLNVAYFAGNLSDDDYTVQAQKIKEEIAAAQKEEQETEKPIDLSALKELLETDFETTYKTLSKMDKRRFWRSVIDEIVIDGKEVACIKYKA